VPPGHVFGIAGPGCRPQDASNRRSDVTIDYARRAYGCWDAPGDSWQGLSRLKAEPADLAIVTDSPALHLPMAKGLERPGARFSTTSPPSCGPGPRGASAGCGGGQSVAAILRLKRHISRIAASMLVRGSSADRANAGRQPDAALSQAYVAMETRVACLRDPGATSSARSARRSRSPRPSPNGTRGCIPLRRRGRPGAALIREICRDDTAHSLEVARLSEILSVADLPCAPPDGHPGGACHGVPMVVMYNGSKWDTAGGRHLITTPHLSLVNILAGRRVVPEFMPYYDSTDPSRSRPSTSGTRPGGRP